MLNNKKNLLFVIIGLIVVVIIIVFALSQGGKKATNPNGTTTKNGILALQTGNSAEEKAAAEKKPNANATFEVGGGAITPKSFMVEYPSDATLTFTSSDGKAHDIVFDSPEVGVDHVAVSESEPKTVIFKTPKPGQYAFSCSITGHKEKGEVGELIVSEKPTKVNPIVAIDKTVDEQRIPSANILISNGTMTPNKFTVAAGLPTALGIISGDNQAHNVVFADKKVAAEILQVPANGTKSTTFNAPVAGEYEFYCNIPGHEKETGKMIVK